MADEEESQEGGFRHSLRIVNFVEKNVDGDGDDEVLKRFSGFTFDIPEQGDEFDLMEFTSEKAEEDSVESVEENGRLDSIGEFTVTEVDKAYIDVNRGENEIDAPALMANVFLIRTESDGGEDDESN